MKPSLFISILVMTLVVIAPSLPASAKEGSHANSTHTEQQVGHAPEHQAETKAQQTHEEQGKHAETGHAPEHQAAAKTQPAHEEQGKHAEQAGHGEQTGHKEYPKLAEGIHKIAYFAVGFIAFVLIAVPIGAHMEKKKHPHTSHH